MDLRVHVQTLAGFRRPSAAGVLAAAVAGGCGGSTAGPSSAPGSTCGLDDAPALWGVYSEGGATGTVTAASGSRSGVSALACTYSGGAAYRAVRCSRNREDDGVPSAFVLSVDPRPPATSFNDRAGGLWCRRSSSR